MPVSNTSDTAVNTILKLINDNGSISQTRMFELSGYSRPMISIACEQLIHNRLIVTDNTKTMNKKKNIEYKLNVDLGYIIGIAIGGTSCRIGMFNILCETVEIIRYPVDLIRGPEAILREIDEHISYLQGKYCTDAKKILGIGMAIPSPVKYEEGYANYPAFMPGWHMFDLKSYFQTKYGCPAFIDNEVNTMALEEYQQRTNKQQHVLLCIKVGTGIGSGLVIDNKIYRGENGGGGNIGHIQISNATELCECGKTGCIEAIASAPAILRKTMEKALAAPDSQLHELYQRKNGLEICDIKTAADKGDRIALGIIQHAGESIGEIIGMLTMFLDPAQIVIAGQLTQLGPNYLYYIRNMIQKKAYPWIGHNFSVEFSQLPTSSAAIGAARLCISELFARQIILQAAEASPKI